MSPLELVFLVGALAAERDDGRAFAARSERLNELIQRFEGGGGPVTGHDRRERERTLVRATHR